MSSYHSNLPGGLSPHDLPGWHRSAHKDVYQCDSCGREGIDPIESPMHVVDGRNCIGKFVEHVCSECVLMCDCGEYIETANAHLGIGIKYRDPLAAGAYVHGHAYCAVSAILSAFCDAIVDEYSLTREEITEIMQYQFAEVNHV